MHAVHLPPRHLWGTAALALVLAVVTLAFAGLSRVELPSRGDTASPPGVTAPATRPAPRSPAWVADPLRPPAFER